MLKKIITAMLLFFVISPVFAGELEDAIKNNDYVFLYLYTKDCGYCRKFNPLYLQATKNHNDKLRFVKIDANTNYGYHIMSHYRAHYVPFVVLINTKSNKGAQIGGKCLLSNACLNHAIKSFIK